MAYTPNIKIDITYERLLAKVRNNPAVQFLIATLNELYILHTNTPFVIAHLSD